MNRLRVLTGPVATLALLVATHQWPDILGATTALAFVPLVWAAYVAGLWPALASAGIITGFAVHLYLPDYSRIIQVSASAVIIALLTSELKRRARLAETIDDNMARLKEIVELARKLDLEWKNLTDQEQREQLVLIEDRLGNLAGLVYGWIAIGREIRETKKYVGMEETDG